MPTNSENVLVALTGAVYVAPVGTTAPVDSSTAWGAEWTDVGYLSEDGIDEEHDDDSTQIKAWQNGDTVRNVITGTEATYGFMLIETTATGLGLYYKGSALTGTGTGPGSMDVTSPTVDRRAFGFDVIDGPRIVRWVVPNGEVTERQGITYKNDEPVGYGLTITAYPGADRVHTKRFWSELDGLPAGV